MHTALDPVATAWSTAVPDWAERIVQRRSIIPELPLHAARADKALHIFRQLRVPDIEGHPTYGEICEPFVFELVRAIFGAFDQATGLRMIREYFLLLPKKNGKSAIASAVIVTAAILNEKPSEELLLIAPTMNIAERNFRQAAGIIRLTVIDGEWPLSDLFSLHDHLKTIRNLNPKIPSEISVKAADSEVITGSKAGVVLVDETHVFASRPAAKGVFLEIRGALSHPKNKGFFLQITTQSKIAPQGVFRAELERARDVRDGKILHPLLAVLYELPAERIEDGGWKHRETWGMVNPHLGRSVSEAFLAAELATAESDGPDALALLASQHFNVEIGTAQWGDAWGAVRYWDAAVLSGLIVAPLDHLMTMSEVVTIGGDGGGDDDLLGFAAIGRHRETGEWLVWAKVWAQPEVLDRRKSIAPTLLDFAAEGDLVICETPLQHVEEFADLAQMFHKAGLLPEKNGIGLDTAGLPEIVDALIARGMEPPLVTAVAQGWKLQAAVKSVPLRLKSKRLRHYGQKILGWSVGNAKAEIVKNNVYLTKQLSGSAKIDPVIAMLNAAMLMFENPQAAGSGVTPWDADPNYRMAV